MEPDGYHSLVHWIAHAIGHHVSDQAPAWLHPVLHVVLIWMPLGLLALGAGYLVRAIRRRRAMPGRSEST